MSGAVTNYFSVSGFETKNTPGKYGAYPRVSLNYDAPIFMSELSLPFGKNASQEFPSWKRTNSKNSFTPKQSAPSKQKGALPKFIELQKTEMCHFLLDYGNCPYGERCQYAHSENELRTVTRHPKYKTTACRQFQLKGECPYGRRCQFIHEPKEASKPVCNINLTLQIQPQRVNFAKTQQHYFKQQQKQQQMEGVLERNGSQKEVGSQGVGGEVVSGGRRLPVFVLLSQGILPQSLNN
eukprot:TRINITY_DN3925_c0_g1_i3.p2 TRINITY_DN3925_c0_g1~~TRINITY_DN3925_c0_g1_i3.p2  ORF type:complete len:238 (+),score=21.09 TRINITY_DN3925_c0_g1_i3:303-1016(+)